MLFCSMLLCRIYFNHFFAQPLSFEIQYCHHQEKGEIDSFRADFRAPLLIEF